MKLYCYQFTNRKIKKENVFVVEEIRYSTSLIFKNKVVTLLSHRKDGCVNNRFLNWINDPNVCWGMLFLKEINDNQKNKISNFIIGKKQQ